MSYTINVTPLDSEGSTKAIGDIHIGKKLSATFFIKENENGLYVQRPGYETKKKDENGKPIWNNYLGMIGEGSITKLNAAIMNEYNKMIAGGERSEIEDQELKIEVINVTPRKSDVNKYERGIASIKVNDEFILNSIKVLEGKYGLYISFPSSFDADKSKEYKYIEAKADVRKEIDKQIIATYEKVLDEEPDIEKEKDIKKTEEKEEKKEKKTKAKKETSR